MSAARESSDATDDKKTPPAGPVEARVHPFFKFLNRAIFVLTLAVIPLTAIPYGSVERWWEAVFECLVFGLVALWAMEGLALGGVYDVRGKAVLLPLVAIVAYGYLQSASLGMLSNTGWSAISADPYGTRLFATKLLAVSAFGALLWRNLSSTRRLKALIWTLLATVVASAIFGMVRETTQQEGLGFLLPQLKAGIGYGQFINRNHFAYLMEIGLGLALGIAAARGERRNTLIYLGVALPIWVALIFSSSRGGILSMLCEVLFLGFIYGTYRRSHRLEESNHNSAGFTAQIRNLISRTPVRIVLILALLAAVVAGVIWIGGDPLSRRFETLQAEVKNEEADAGEGAKRLQIWNASWRMFKDHPVAGIGFGGYWVAITEYYNVPGQKRPYEAHNDYLELLVSGGVIGVALFAWLLIAIVKQTRTTLQSKDSLRRAAAIGALTGLCGIAIHSIVDFGLHITINAVACMALIVIATTDERVEDRETKRHRHRRTRRS